MIETERLLLRKLISDDAERIFLLDSHPEVMKYIGVPVSTSIEESIKAIEFIGKQYEENGVGRLAVIEKSSNLLIGWSGLKLNKEMVNNHQNFYELGYRFLPEYWGKGYATESAIASLKYGFNELKLEKIFAYADVDNESSNYILKKLGFTLTNEFLESGDVCYWYELGEENFIYNTLKK